MNRDEVKELLDAQEGRTAARIRELDVGLSARIDELDARFSARIDEMDTRLSVRMDEQDARFTKRLDELDAKFTARMDEQDAKFTARLDEQDARFSKRLDEQEARLTAHLDEQMAKFFGQMSAHFEDRLQAELDPIRAEIRELRAVMDGIAKRLETDEQERAIIAHEQDKHASWIRQLAEATGTKLMPEQ